MRRVGKTSRPARQNQLAAGASQGAGHQVAGQKLLNLLNTLLPIVGLLISVLTYLESKKPLFSPPVPAPAKPAAKPVSIPAVQALLLPHLPELLRQARPAR